MAKGSEMKDNAVLVANAKREELLATEAVKTIQIWSDSAKAAIEAQAAIAKAQGDEAVKKAQEAAAAALKVAEEKRLEAVKVSGLYMCYAQDQVSSLAETD